MFAINSTADNLALQQDLDKLELWSNTWQMDFNVEKCAIMQFTTPSTPKQEFDYKMKGEILEIVSHHPYLGVEFSDNLKFLMTILTTSLKIFINTRISETQLKILSTKSKGESLFQPCET